MRWQVVWSVGRVWPHVTLQRPQEQNSRASVGFEVQVAFQAQSAVIAVIAVKAVKTFWMSAQVASPELCSAEQLWRQSLMSHAPGQL